MNRKNSFITCVLMLFIHSRDRSWGLSQFVTADYKELLMKFV